MRAIALQTTRNGSVGVPGKNTLRVGGEPLFVHGLRRALRARSLARVFAISDIPDVHMRATAEGYQAISLPAPVAAGNHYAAIMLGLESAEAVVGAVDVVVVLLGNTLGAAPRNIDDAVKILEDESGLDSVCSVSAFNPFNPARAFRVDTHGELETVVPQSVLEQLVSTDSNVRGTLGECYFFNGSFWACRRRALVERSGGIPFPWLGRRTRAFVEPPRMEIDDPWQVDVLHAMFSEGRLAGDDEPP